MDDGTKVETNVINLNEVSNEKVEWRARTAIVMAYHLAKNILIKRGCPDDILQGDYAGISKKVDEAIKDNITFSALFFGTLMSPLQNASDDIFKKIIEDYDGQENEADGPPTKG